MARFEGLILSFQFGLASPCRRAPLFSQFQLFSGSAAWRPFLFREAFPQNESEVEKSMLLLSTTMLFKIKVNFKVIFRSFKVLSVAM